MTVKDELQACLAELEAARAGQRQAEEALQLAQEKLRASEQQSYAVLDALPAPILLSRISDGQVLHANPQLRKLMGLALEEVQGYQTPDFYNDPADRQTLLETLQRQGRLSNYELRLKRGDGTPFWATLSAERSTFAGAPALLTVIFDITERKQTEAALRRSEASYRQLYNSFTDGLASVSLEGFVTECNPAFERITGYSLEELRQIKFTDLTPARWHAMENKILTEQALTRGYTDPYEKEYIRKDGVIIPVELVVYTIKGADDAPIGFWGFIRDLTTRKQSEAAARQLEMRFRDIVASMGDWVWEVDAQGRYIYSSEKVVDFLGYTADEMLGKTPFDLMPPEEMARVGKIFGEIVANRQRITDLENWNITKDGRRVCLLTNGIPILGPDGTLIGYRGVDRDITERKRAEEERSRLQQEIIQAQQQAIKELATPIIPVMDRIIVMPLIGSIDTMRAKDITRALLAGISEYRAKIVILDITGVPLVDSGVADHLNKTIQAARLKGAQTIVTGVSDAVAEAIVDLGIDWSSFQTLSDLQTGLVMALNSLGLRLVARD